MAETDVAAAPGGTPTRGASSARVATMNPKALLVVFLLTMITLAGCLGGTDTAPEEDVAADPWAKLSPVLYDNVKQIHIPVAAPDGKLQDTWAYIPETSDAEARFPVFIDLSPYWNNLKPHARDGGDKFSQHLIDFYVPRGYAVVLASIRGTGDSAGCMTIGGIPELEAAYAIIDHYANVEWSNGHIAMGGRSYDGTTIQGVAGYKPHPALKLIFPVSGISDMYRYNYRGGVPYGHGSIFNTYFWAGTGVQQYGDPMDQDPLLLIDDIACPELPGMQANGVGSGVTGLYTDYWDERNYIRYAKNVQAALFYVHGFQDWNVKPDHILPWLQALPADVPKKVWLHQWTERNGHVFPLREDWNLTMLRVLDHFLKGIDTGILDGPMAQIEDSSGLWRHEDVWPPRHAVSTPLYLGDGGRLAWDAPAGGTAEANGMGGGVLTWELELQDELRYAGEPVLHARLATSDPEAAWVAQLHLVDNGETKWMNEGVLRARLKDSMHMPTAILPLEAYDYEIRFYPQDDVFPAGSTLRLTLSQAGSLFAVTPEKPASTTVELGEMSYLELPLYHVLNLEDPQPKDMYCWHC
jgi:predicted acyl esterase